MPYLKVACATMAGAWLAGTMLYAGYAGAQMALGGGAPAGYEAGYWFSARYFPSKCARAAFMTVQWVCSCGSSARLVPC